MNTREARIRENIQGMFLMLYWVGAFWFADTQRGKRMEDTLHGLGIALFLVGMMYFVIPHVAGRWNRKGFSGFVSIGGIMAGTPLVLHFWSSLFLQMWRPDGSSELWSMLVVLGISYLAVAIPTTALVLVGILIGGYVRWCWPPPKAACTSRG